MMNPVDLESAVDRELRQLPLPQAPHTLLPRVLAAVQHWAQRPWYARAWVTWPVGWQVASLAALMLLSSSSLAVFPIVQAAAAGRASTFMAGVASTAQRVEMTTTAVRILWSTLLQPFVTYVFTLVVLMCLACAAFGAALNQVVLGRAFQR